MQNLYLEINQNSTGWTICLGCSTAVKNQKIAQKTSWTSVRCPLLLWKGQTADWGAEIRHRLPGRMINPTAFVMCLLGWHVCSNTALWEQGGPAGRGIEQRFRKIKQKTKILWDCELFNLGEGPLKEVMVITHLTCIWKPECPQLGLDQEGVRHETTHPLGTEKQSSSLIERNLKDIGKASAGTAKDMTLSGAAEGLHVLSSLLPHLLKCHGKYSFESWQSISGETIILLHTPSQSLREGRCLCSSLCSDCAMKANAEVD